jgi:hypothetical protein
MNGGKDGQTDFIGTRECIPEVSFCCSPSVPLLHCLGFGSLEVIRRLVFPSLVFSLPHLLSIFLFAFFTASLIFLSR